MGRTKTKRTSKKMKRTSKKMKGTSKKTCFQRYDIEKKGYLTEREFRTLVHTEYRLKPHSPVLDSCIATWFDVHEGARILAWTTFRAMFRDPDGFLRAYR